MGIYSKLLKIQQKVNGLGKDKKSYNFSYVTGDKLLGEIKPLMNELGLLLKQEVLGIENNRIDYVTTQGKDASEMHSTVMMRFTWIDAETGETDVNLFGANGQNGWDKGVGSALTYGERYFILKYFHIATDEDDIDHPELKTGKNEIKAAPVSVPAKELATISTKEEVPAATVAMADNRQKAELKKLLENPEITSAERATGLTKITTYTYEQAAKAINALNNVIAKRESETKSAALEVAGEEPPF